MERRVFESTDEREIMRVIPCEQGSEEWCMIRKDYPTASCASKIVQPQLESKTFKNTNKKAVKLVYVKVEPDGISIDILSETPHGVNKEDIETVEAGKTLSAIFTQVLFLEPGASVTARGGFIPSKSRRGYICLLIAQAKSKAPAQWIDYLAAVRHGTETEPEARRIYEFNHDKKVEQVGFCVTDDGHFGCSPDGLIDDRQGGLEIKCPNLDTHLGYVMDGILPNVYKLQVHGSMHVTGTDYWDFMSYYPGEDPFLIRTHRDDYTNKLADALEAFYVELEQARRKFGVSC